MTTAVAAVAAVVASLTVLPFSEVRAAEGRAAGFRVLEAPERRILRGSGEDRPTTVRASGPLLRAQQAAEPTSTFVVTYLSPVTDQQRAAFQAAVDIWSHIVVSSVPIEVEADIAEQPPRVLGSAGPAAAASAGDTRYAIALANSIAGRDIAPDLPDIQATFSNNSSLFYFGTDGRVPAGQYDFVTTVLHEIGHGLGFLNGLEVVNGLGTYDPGATDPKPFIYDRFLVRRTAQGDIRALSYPRESVALAEALESESLYWDGGSATAAAGGNPHIYAPPVYEPGSSIGHLDEATYPPGTRDALMTPEINPQEVSRDPGAIANAMLEDQGWRLSSAADPTPPSGSSPSPSATPTATFAPSPSPTPPSSTGSRYTGLSPSRILDTRNGTGTGVTGRVGPGGTVDVVVAGRGGVPQDATAVVLNLTGVGASASTDVRAYPASSSTSIPAVSNLNLPRGGTRANLATVPVGPGGAVRLRNQSGTVHLLADVAGYYATTAAAAFFPLDPERVLDTRNGIGTGGRIFKLGGGQTLDLRVTGGTSSVPPTAQAVVLNVTAAGASEPTDIRVYPTRFGTSTFPNVSNLNVRRGGPVPNLVIARVGDDGQVRLRNNAGTVSLIADVFGYYERSAEGALFRPVTPTRLLDSRPGRLGEMQVLDVDTDASGPVPTGATAVALNVTGVGASNGTDLRVYPTPLSSTTRPPSVSTLNLVRGQTAAAAAVVRTGNGQAVRVYNNTGTVAVLVDVAGWFGPA